ncbi:MAG: hypothetical protein R3E08_00485 [Thiotrichaceae bacterium]
MINMESAHQNGWKRLELDLMVQYHADVGWYQIRNALKKRNEKEQIMYATIKAIYENGQVILQEPPPTAEKTNVIDK